MAREPKIDDEVIFCDGSKILQGFIFAIYKGKIFHVKTKEGDFVLRKEEMFDNFFDIYEKCYEVTEEWEKLHYYEDGCGKTHYFSGWMKAALIKI